MLIFLSILLNKNVRSLSSAEVSHNFFFFFLGGGGGGGGGGMALFMPVRFVVDFDEYF